MVATVVFLSALHQKKTSATFAGPRSIPVGIDAAGIGKIRSGHYVANRDLKTLAKPSDISADKLNYFTGNVYILSTDPKVPTTISYFQSGHLRQYHKDTGKVDFSTAIGDYLNSYQGSDVRLAEATFASFEVSLPTEAKKLDNFTGSITYFAKDMKKEQSLTIFLKGGKVVSARS